MSVEAFMTPLGDSRLNITKRNEEDRVRGIARSLYHSLALEFSDKGRLGIKEVEERARKRGIRGIFFPGSNVLKMLPPHEQDKFMVNYAGIWFGLSMRAIEIALCEQYFDPEEFCGWLENATVGTTIPSTYMVIEDPHIPDEQWQEMLEIDREDKTHTAFFIDGAGYEVLPESLAELLEQSLNLDIIREKILPAYSRLAREIVLPLLPPNQW